jgi:hypothetical protein
MAKRRKPTKPKPDDERVYKALGVWSYYAPVVTDHCGFCAACIVFELGAGHTQTEVYTHGLDVGSQALLIRFNEYHQLSVGRRPLTFASTLVDPEVRRTCDLVAKALSSVSDHGIVLAPAVNGTESYGHFWGMQMVVEQAAAVLALDFSPQPEG